MPLKYCFLFVLRMNHNVSCSFRNKIHIDNGENRFYLMFCSFPFFLAFFIVVIHMKDTQYGYQWLTTNKVTRISNNVHVYLLSPLFQLICTRDNIDVAMHLVNSFKLPTEYTEYKYPVLVIIIFVAFAFIR